MVKREMMNGTRWWHLVLLGLLILSACSPSQFSRQRDTAGFPESVQVKERFDEAERLIERAAYLEAVAIYEAYLKEFPRGNLADKALAKSGLMLIAAGKYEQAREAFERLLDQFPRSPFSGDARFNVILVYYTEGDYQSAVESGKTALKKATSADQEYRIHNLLGYVFSADRKFLKAFESYMKAYEKGGEDHRPEILSKVKEVISYLNEEELLGLMEQYGETVPGGYLRLQLAKVYATEDLVEAAMAVLYEFRDLFPYHEEIETSEAMLQELFSRARVDQYLIGCILPLSGRYETFGNRALAGIELALDELHADPDVHPVRLLIRDSKGEPAEAVAALEDLVLEEGVVAVIGPMVTAESVANRAEALRVPIIALTQKPGITTIGDYVFRDFLTLSLQVKALVEYAVHDLGIQRCAIFYPDEPYGVNFMNRFWDELTSQGAEVVGIESYAPDQTDFRDAIKKLVGLYYPRFEEHSRKDISGEAAVWDKLLEMKEFELDWSVSDQIDRLLEMESRENRGWLQEENKPDPIIDFEAIFIPDSFDKIGLIAPQLIYHDIVDVLLLGTNLWHSQRLLDIAQGYVQGAIVPDGFFMDSPSIDVQVFVESYKSVFGESPGYLEAQAYDVASVLFRAANNPDVRSRLTLMTVLQEMDTFYGVTGTNAFGETGNAEKALYLLTIEGGKFVQIKP